MTPPVAPLPPPAALATAVALALLLGVGALGGLAPDLVMVNESPSLPRGLYLRAPGAPVGRGAVVALAQPPAARLYLGGLGMPAEVRLIKRVAAGGGDRVCRAGDTLRTPGRLVHVHRRDRRGVALPRWAGCRRLAAGELFLLGDTPDSFDSRYFGPVRTAGVDGVFREAVTW